MARTKTGSGKRKADEDNDPQIGPSLTSASKRLRSSKVIGKTSEQDEKPPYLIHRGSWDDTRYLVKRGINVHFHGTTTTTLADRTVRFPGLYVQSDEYGMCMIFTLDDRLRDAVYGQIQHDVRFSDETEGMAGTAPGDAFDAVLDPEWESAEARVEDDGTVMAGGWQFRMERVLTTDERQSRG